MTRASRRPPVRRAVKVLLLAVAVGSVVFLFVLPGRTWIDQSRSTSAAQRRLRILTAENAALARRVAELHDPAYIEQVARAQYGLVMPGEKAYGILPPSTTTTVPPPRGPG
jgi:cell division protein FtsB